MAYQAWVTNAQTVLRQRRERAQQERAGQLPTGELPWGPGWGAAGLPDTDQSLFPGGGPSQEVEPVEALEDEVAGT
jgi:hypothetical protein